MIKPTLNREKVLWRSGIDVVGGIDEAGRGAWAGPVVAAVVVLPKSHKMHPAITDSKLLTAKARTDLFEHITTEALDFGVGVVSHKVIDKIGIVPATKRAAKEAVEMLGSKPDYLLCDALDLTQELAHPQESIIKGDQKIYSIACASIVAKVTRDNLMTMLGGKYEVYQFGKHKGYGTALHQKVLRDFGVSDIHRLTYKPVKAFFNE